MILNIRLESVDGRVHTEIDAQTSKKKICGGMKAVDCIWVEKKGLWSHLQDIPFSKLARRERIDVLLWTDNYHLIYPKKEVIGGVGDSTLQISRALEIPMGKATF